MAPSMEKWVGFGSAMAGFALLWSKLIPDHVQEEATNIMSSWSPMVAAYFNPYEQITIAEYSDDEQFRRNKLFDLVSAYLSSRCMGGARKLNAVLAGDGVGTQFGLDDNQEVVDRCHGTRVWWNLCKASKNSNSSTVINVYPPEEGEAETRHYRLVFHKRHRKLVQDSYLPDVIKQGSELIAKTRRRRLFTHHARGKSLWTAIPWKHPATFDTLAMDPTKKNEIMDDLMAFRKGKSYHSKVGKAWKRGYLLYGPPGTGKSSMISAMADFLGYDVYDLDLTTVTRNTDLRKLFLETTEQSIIVIEDIHAIEDDITTRLKDKKAVKGDKLHQLPFLYAKDKVTLSGLLSFIDGLWSACGGERIIVLTTNHLDQLDPALIRRGRMDKHVEMSYCRFEAFKVLANNYLGITEHPLFGAIQRLLYETNTTPADVAHSLMPRGKRNADECLTGLVQTLKKARMESAGTPPSMSPVKRSTKYNLRQKKRARQGNRNIICS
uniref:AAA+ ATPase domain-containing protein n=1 Tax=Leersia perrieri TaxID=77586 RepID=A0A0D9XZ70_9ORYZ